MAKKYEKVVEVALAMMVDGPEDLKQALNLASTKVTGRAWLDAKGLADQLGAAGPDDPLIGLMHRRLTEWDFLRSGSWTGGTEPNTRARRDLIYDRLRCPPELVAEMEGKVPPYVSPDILVVIADEHEEWYDRQEAAISAFYWPAYIRYLRDVKHWPEESIQALDASTDEIVERLSAPWREEEYQSKGLVVGHVQSGKTASFTGVIAKAADAGYRLVIVLGGTMNILRNQTQRRVDKELIGAEQLEDEYLDDDEWTSFISHGVRPSERGAYDWHRLTTREDDYKSLSVGIETLNFLKADPTKPFYDRTNLRTSAAKIMVVKKIPSRLKKVAKDLGRIRARLTEIPTLVIDDESDQASLNTRRPTAKEEKSRTATNKAIVELLAQLPRAQYVGYTATPFANVFVDPDDAADLFPKDFIISLPKPTNYMGATDFHDFDEERDGFDSNERAFIRDVIGQDTEPENLQRAIDSWLLSGAIKLYREERLGTHHRHHTMLVHVSQRVAHHDRIAKEIHKILETSGYHGGGCIDRLERLWLEDYLAVSQARNAERLPMPMRFDELIPQLGLTLSRLESDDKPVLMVNGQNNDDTPDFDRESIWKILVGGTKLSRGYTVEGLTVSYYRRSAWAADTLMQMGRWFGYRPGYRDLVRVFIGRDGKVDLYEAFGGACRDEIEFRDELKRYAKPEVGKPITPIQVPPLVPQHLLRPTASNKMFNAILVSQNLKKRWIERTAAPTEPADVLRNLESLAAMLKTTTLSREQVGVRSGAKGSSIFNAIVGHLTPEAVLAFLSAYKWLPNRRPLDREIEFLKGEHGNPAIDRWVFLGPQIDSPLDLVDLAGKQFGVVQRAREADGERYGVYSDPANRPTARYAAGIENCEPATPATSALGSGRQAVFVCHLVRDPERDPARIARGKPFATVGFALLFPDNQIEVPIRFSVKSEKHQDQPVVDRADD